MRSFNEIYILDLHGNSLKKEICPDGSPDENVFDIRQGVAIAFFIKKKSPKESCSVHHSELWGSREKKYDWLRKNDIETTDWVEISPKTGFYLFVPRDETLIEAYESNPKITDIFKLNSVGIVTARDNLTIHWSLDDAWTTVSTFSKMDKELARQAYNLGKDSNDWKVEWAQKDLLESGLDKNKIVPILYRPFDLRYTYYTGKSGGFICRPRPEVMQHMLNNNIGLVTVRQVAEGIFNHGLITDSIIESRITLSNKGIGFLFPLYVCQNSDRESLFDKERNDDVKLPNIASTILEKFRSHFGIQIKPEEIFHYIYAVLYSNIYRSRYAEFLKMDFPRIPFTSDVGLFQQMADLGRRLADLHLLRAKELETPLARFQGHGNGRVEKVIYKEGRVYINQSQYFEPVPLEVWSYQIGGYQVCSKWLKDRKGRILSLDEIKKYCQIVTALKITIDVQQQIDDLYPLIENAVINFIER